MKKKLGNILKNGWKKLCEVFKIFGKSKKKKTILDVLKGTGKWILHHPVVAAVVVLLVVGCLLYFSGRGGGKGEGIGQGDGTVASSNVAGNDQSDLASEQEQTTDVTPMADLTATPVPTLPPEQKEYLVRLNGSKIYCNNQEYIDMQSLLDVILDEVGDPELVYIVVDEEKATANAYQNVENILNQSGIDWDKVEP